MMSEQRTIQLSGVYDGNQKPYRVGVYRRLHPGGPSGGHIMWSYWDGKQWGLSKLLPELAKPGKPSRWQRLTWQGLASDPSGVAS